MFDQSTPLCSSASGTQGVRYLEPKVSGIWAQGVLYLVLTVVPRRGQQRCTNNISVFIFVRHVFMSSLLIKPIIQHHRSRVSHAQLRDFPLHLWGNLTVKDPTQQRGALRSILKGNTELNPEANSNALMFRFTKEYIRM